jgi:hypothetical protein
MALLFQHHLAAMLSRLPDLRTVMFGGYVDTFEASSSTVLVRSWRLTKKLGNDNAMIA